MWTRAKRTIRRLIHTEWLLLEHGRILSTSMSAKINTCLIIASQCVYEDLSGKLFSSCIYDKLLPDNSKPLANTLATKSSNEGNAPNNIIIEHLLDERCMMKTKNASLKVHLHLSRRFLSTSVFWNDDLWL